MRAGGRTRSSAYEVEIRRHCRAAMPSFKVLAPFQVRHGFLLQHVDTFLRVPFSAFVGQALPGGEHSSLDLNVGCIVVFPPTS